MTTFAYKARDANGNLIQGVVEAENESRAASHVQELNLSPVSISVQSASGFAGFSWLPSFSRVSRQEVLVFTRQLATLVGTGVPLIQSLENVEKQSLNPHFKTVIQGLMNALKSGSSLSEALSRYPNVFPELFVSMMKVGETAGLLDKVLKRLAELSSQDIDLRSRLRGALIYPMVLAGVAFLIVNFVMIGVLPKFVSIFEASEANLPVPTVILMSLSDTLRNYWWLIGMGVGLLIMSFRSYYRSPQGHYRVDFLLLRMPLIGNLMLKILVCRFARSIAALTYSGVPVLEALTVVGPTVGNVVLEGIIEDVREAISRGQSLTEPFQASGLFPPMVIQLINTGERSGRLGEMFDQIASFYEPEVEYTLRNLTSILEPVMLLVMGAVVAFIALSVLLPIFNLIRVIRR